MEFIKSYEGQLFNTAENNERLQKLEAGEMVEGIIEAMPQKVTAEKNMCFQFGKNFGVISPYDFCPNRNATTFINTYVSAPVSFCVESVAEATNGAKLYTLSRKKALENYWDDNFSNLKVGDVIEAVVKIVKQKGIFLDIGGGFATFLRAQDICYASIQDLRKYFVVGEKRPICISGIEGRTIYASSVPLYGTFNDNAEKYSIGDEVLGTVVANTGTDIHVSIAPNFVGLLDTYIDLKVGQNVRVRINRIDCTKLKLKLEYKASYSDVIMETTFPLIKSNEKTIKLGSNECWYYAINPLGKTVYYTQRNLKQVEEVE